MGVIASLVQPPLVPLTQIERHLGTTIRTRGLLLEARTYDGGWTRLLLADENRTVDAVGDAPPTVSTGDRVEITGIANRAGTRIQVELDHDAIRVLQSWQDGNVPLRTLVQAPWNFQGAHLRTTGIIERAGPTTWVHDPSSSAKVHGGGPALDDVDEGPTMLLEATLEYDLESATFRLHVIHAAPAPRTGA